MKLLTLLFLFVFACIYNTNAQITSRVPWIWMNGNTTINTTSIYGTQTVPATTNRVGGRQSAVSWSDPGGYLWLFGGYGLATTTSVGELADLWRYNLSNGTWTWMKGTNTINSTGLYNSPGVFQNTNRPGGRDFGVSWVDGNNNLWMFGGFGNGGSTAQGELNDLWQFNKSLNQWAWMEGDTTLNTPGIYGLQGTPNNFNKPGARDGAASWTSGTDLLWMFGGFGFAETGSANGYLNDLWVYNIPKKQWTWVKGTKSLDQPARYGIRGVPDTANTPGGLYGSTYWTDTLGNFWLFGGYRPTGRVNNQLWRYSISANAWTWMKGDTTSANGTPFYGTIDEAASVNTPGGRYGSNSWVDQYGNLVLFGGYGYTAIGAGVLNDLWRYNIGKNQWTWVKGDSIPNGVGNYGSQGQGSVNNKPGARYLGTSWKDLYGNFWMFGGNGIAATTGSGRLNDLWRIISPTTYRFIGNGDWFTPSNWLNNLVPSDTIRQDMIVIIDPNGVCNHTGQIHILPFGTLTIQPGKNLNIINGDLFNNGNMQGPGSITFSGANSSNLTSPGTVTTPLHLLGKRLVLQADMHSVGIELTGGSFIELGNYNLFMDTATLVANNQNFIITNGTGSLYRFVSANGKSYPIGISDTSYTPAFLSNSGSSKLNSTSTYGPGDTFSVRVTLGVVNKINGTPITLGVVNRSWVVSEGTVGGSNVTVTLQWNAGDELPGFRANACAISSVCPPPPNCQDGYDIRSMTPAAGTGPFLISRDGITSFKIPETFIVRTSPVIFNFIGSGSWFSPANWSEGLVPTPPIKQGWEVNINPPVSGDCTFPGVLQVEPGGIVNVKAGKKLVLK